MILAGSQMMRSITSMIAFAAMILAGGASLAQAASPAPGALIDSQAIAGPPAGGSAYRILYWSTDPDGRPREVSGLVIVPPGPAPAGGRPIVAWAHPTTGVVERCAPSKARLRFQMIAGLRSMVHRGFVVAATDYPGLGTAGPHPYLVGVSEGRAVLDSVRAARAIPQAGAGSRFAVWGHSQGGQAALFAGLIARSYAPELTLVGVAAAAPATDLAALMKEDLASPGGRNLTAMTFWAWSRVYGAPMSEVVQPAAMPAIDHLAGECIESFYDILVRRRTGPRVPADFLKSAYFAETQPWRDLIANNTPGPLPSDIPLFLAQGGGDRLVDPAITTDYAKRQCRAGGSVRLLVLPKVKHGLIADRAAIPAVDWMADRFAGAPAPSDCRAF